MKLIVLVAGAVLIIGNGVNFFIQKPIRVDKDAYAIRDGFPLFTNEREYIRVLQDYPCDMGTVISIHRLQKGESLWTVAAQSNLTIDTILAANPFLKSLDPKPGTHLVLPRSNGVLFAVDDASDVARMERLIDGSAAAEGDYRQSILRLFSFDDVRFVFIKQEKPVYVSTWLQDLYNQRRKFKKPTYGPYSSLFGVRNDPIYNNYAFHNGIDIQSTYGAAIYPIADGLVCAAGWEEGYGQTIRVFHGNGYVSLYGHCSHINVQPEEMVKKSTVIGRVGSTGRSTGPHLHFTMFHHDKPINPYFFLK